MKTALVGVAAIGAITALNAPASAAAVLPTEPPTLALNWSGCFVGANAGPAWTGGRSNYQDPNTTGDPINGLPGPFGTKTYIPPATEKHASGGIGGGGVGCNWQNRQWVYGVEADYNDMNISRSQTAVGPLGSYLPGKASITLSDFVGTANEQVSLGWLSTVRGRVGFAPLDRLLLFATGGLAAGEIKSQGSVGLSNNTFYETWSGSNATVKSGYTLGGGAEWVLSDHWTAKIEYLWYDLGHVSHPLNCIAGNLGGAPCNPFIYPTLGNSLSEVNGSIFRVGVDYQFGGALVGTH
jgi:outer membrane immunogenic protein